MLIKNIEDRWLSERYRVDVVLDDTVTFKVLDKKKKNTVVRWLIEQTTNAFNEYGVDYFNRNEIGRPIAFSLQRVPLLRLTGMWMQ